MIEETFFVFFCSCSTTEICEEDARALGRRASEKRENTGWVSGVFMDR
jgi:hypothetical protein